MADVTPTKTSHPPAAAAAAASSTSPNAADGGLTDSNEDNELALRSMIQQIAAGHTHLTEAVVGDGIQFDVIPLPLTAEQRTTYGWSKEDQANNAKFQQSATQALKEISVWKEVDVTTDNAASRENVSKDLVTYWDKYVKTAEEHGHEACEVVDEFSNVSALVGNIAARMSLELSSGGQDQSTKTDRDLTTKTAPFVPNSLYRMQEDAQVLRCAAFRLKPNEGVYRTTNSLKASLEKIATKAVHRCVRPTGSSSDRFITFMPVDGKSVALSDNTCVDLDDLLYIHMWKNKQEGLRFQLSMLTIGNSFTQHGLGLGVFAAPLCVSVRHLCQYFTVMWLVPIVSKAPLSPPPKITSAVLNLVQKRCGAEGAHLDVFLGVDGRRYVLPPQGTYLPSATADTAVVATSSSGGGVESGEPARPSTSGGGIHSSLRSKHRRPEAVLRNKPSEDPDNQVNTAAGRQMAVLKKIIGITRATGYTLNSAACIDGVHHEFAAEGVCIRDLRAVFFNENSWGGVHKDLRRVMMMRLTGAAAMELQLGVRLAKLQNEVRNLIFAQIIGRTLKSLIESVILATPSDMQLALVNELITRPLLAVIERKAHGAADGPSASDVDSYGAMAPLVAGLVKAVNEVATFKYPVPATIVSEGRDVTFDMLEEPVPILLAGLQMACRKLFLTLNLGDRKSITSMSSRPVMISAAVTSPPLILEKDAPISKRVAALEARFGMVDLVPADQPAMRFLTLQRACFALGVLMKSAVGCSPEDKNLIQELVEDVLPTMIRGEEESHDVTTIPYVASVFPFAVAANVTFAALNAVNTVIVSISRLYPNYSAIPVVEKNVILSILKQLLIELRRPTKEEVESAVRMAEARAELKAKKKKEKEKKKKHKSKHGKGDASPQDDDFELEEPNADGESGRVHNTNSQRKGRRHKDIIGGDGAVASRSGSMTPSKRHLSLPDGDGRASRASSRRTESDAEGADVDGVVDTDDEDELMEVEVLDEHGKALKIVIDGDFNPSQKGLQLTEAQKEAIAKQMAAAEEKRRQMAAERAEAERKAAEKMKELLDKAKKLDESRPSYLARLAAKNAIALAGVQDLYFGFDDDYGGGGANDVDLNAFLANYAKQDIAAADAAMNANNAINTIKNEIAERDALAKENSAKGDNTDKLIDFGSAGDFTRVKSVVFTNTPTNSDGNKGGDSSVANNRRNNQSMMAFGKKSMLMKASTLEDEDMSYLVDDDGNDAGAGDGGPQMSGLTLEDVAKVFKLDAAEMLKNNSFVIANTAAEIPTGTTLSLPPRGKPEVIEAAAARLSLAVAALLKHNPSFKPKDTIPATHSLTVPLPVEGNLAAGVASIAKTSPPKQSQETTTAPTASSPATEEKKKKDKDKSKEKEKSSPKKAAEIAAIKAAAEAAVAEEESFAPRRDIPQLAPTPQPVGDWTLSKSSKKFNLDSKALLKANSDIDGTKALISKERIIALPPQLVGMTVKELAAQLGVTAQLVFDCNAASLALTSLSSEVGEGATVMIPAGGDTYEGMGARIEAFLKGRGSMLGSTSDEKSPKKSKKSKEEPAVDEMSAMEKDIVGKKKKDKKDKEEKKDKKSKKKKGDSDEDGNEEKLFDQAMRNPVIRRLSVVYGYDPLELLRVNPHLHGADENTPVHGIISLPARAEAESIASVADRLGLPIREILLLNPALNENDDVPANYLLSVPAKPPSANSSRSVSSQSNTPNIMGSGKINLSDGQKFDKRLRPDQTGGLGVNIAVNTGARNQEGLDRASALLKRVSIARQNSGNFGSPNAVVGKPQQLRSLNASPTVLSGTFSNSTHPSSIDAGSKQPSFGQGFGGLSNVNRGTPSPLGSGSPASPLPVARTKLSSLAPVGGK